ncbi:hypothetical protein O6H91_Y485000 [Diphasiastrum complanatum]|nr:hypothetical protein O6H91_Y485000 [Diphasiastrum complanatum]
MYAERLLVNRNESVSFGERTPIMRGNEGIAGFAHAQAEVELSDYQRLPGSPSPIDLIQGESITTEAVSDLDRFFERLYNYYCDKGFWCIVTHWIVELLSLGFTICFSGFFLLYVNWHGLQSAKCGIAAAEAGSKPCDLAKEALYEHPLKPLTLYRFMVVTYLAICSLYWIFYFVRFFTQLGETLEIRDFYHKSLGVTEREIQQTSWPILLDKIVRLQQKQRLCVVRELSAHDIIMRIMRKENYMIGMVNKGIFAVSVPPWLPGVGPVLYQGANGACKYLMLTKTLEWSLNWCILQNMFDR